MPQGTRSTYFFNFIHIATTHTATNISSPDPLLLESTPIPTTTAPSHRGRPMARLMIQVYPNPADGGRPVYRVSLASDDDVTPREHEQDHRRAIGKLFPGIDLDGESPRFRVER